MPNKTPKYPKVSVIIPVRNEETHIQSCLKNLPGQTYPSNKIEVVVIDGMSNDNTRARINKFRKEHPRLNLRSINNPKKEIFPALNIGIKNAKGEVIIRLDARTHIKKDYIKQCVKTLLNTKADNVGGVQKPIAQSPTQKAIGIAMSHPFGVGNAQFRLGNKSGFVDTIYLGCFRKNVFKKIGLFDENSGIISEDSDINLRIRKAGGKVYLNKDIAAYYYPRETILKLSQLYFRYGRAKAVNFFKHKRLQSRQLIPAMFLLSIVFLTILSFVHLLFSQLLFSLLSVYLMTSLLSSLQLSIKNRSYCLFARLIIIFPVIHFSWAFGFWARFLGLVK